LQRAMYPTRPVVPAVEPPGRGCGELPPRCCVKPFELSIASSIYVPIQG